MYAAFLGAWPLRRHKSQPSTRELKSRSFCSLPYHIASLVSRVQLEVIRSKYQQQHNCTDIMCWVSTAPKRYIVHNGDAPLPPRRVSNYRGGPRPTETITYVRSNRDSISPSKERFSYRSSRSSLPRASREVVDYRRTSKTIIRN